MAKLKVNDLKKHLQGYDRNDLVRLIVELAKQSKEAENYLTSRVYNEEENNNA